MASKNDFPGPWTQIRFPRFVLPPVWPSTGRNLGNGRSGQDPPFPKGSAFGVSTRNIRKIPSPPREKADSPSVVGWTEIIRRNSCHPDRIPIRIQLKPLGVGPYVRTVVSDKNEARYRSVESFFHVHNFSTYANGGKKKLGETS